MVSIEKVSLEEVGKLQAIGRQTFLATFAKNNTDEDMRRYLDESFAVSKLADELNTPGSEFYFAIESGEIVGYLKANLYSAQTEMKDPDALEIERIYVLEQSQGKKVGQLLCDKAIEIARDNDLHYVWLGVWEKNTRAIRFYEKNGFKEFGQHIFRLGEDEQTDIMMRKPLRE